ncbi:unnamed protein product [Paramecium pentaurelia]|uniref:Uncharacterized protein n=1 Tax=Paramecium pentaurelia TaxID=43138 RepID=A0A8S1U5W2_9CILI|nr:unnamed protein product [Paramecium pentaurelia]
MNEIIIKVKIFDTKEKGYVEKYKVNDVLRYNQQNLILSTQIFRQLEVYQQVQCGCKDYEYQIS